MVYTFHSSNTHLAIVSTHGKLMTTIQRWYPELVALVGYASCKVREIIKVMSENKVLIYIYIHNLLKYLPTGMSGFNMYRDCCWLILHVLPLLSNHSMGDFMD